MIPFLLAVRVSLTLPADLVDVHAARTGYAFVGQSGRVPLPGVLRQRDGTAVVNLARNRWDLRCDLREGWSRGITVPLQNVIDPQAALTSYPVGARIREDRLSRPGGVFVRVDELMRHWPQAPRVHWCLARRSVHARVDVRSFADANRAVAATNALAASIGGRWLPRTNEIVIDPVVFRAQALATLRERLGRVDDVASRGTSDELATLAFETMSDETLLQAYEAPNKATYFEVAGGLDNARLRRYIEVKLRGHDLDPNGSGDYIRTNMDLEAPPFIQFTPTGGIGVAVKKKGSETRMIF